MRESIDKWAEYEISGGEGSRIFIMAMTTTNFILLASLLLFHTDPSVGPDSALTFAGFMMAMVFGLYLLFSHLPEIARTIKRIQEWRGTNG